MDDQTKASIERLTAEQIKEIRSLQFWELHAAETRDTLLAHIGALQTEIVAKQGLQAFHMEHLRQYAAESIQLRQALQTIRGYVDPNGDDMRIAGWCEGVDELLAQPATDAQDERR
jgi:hypothetical protein